MLQKPHHASPGECCLMYGAGRIFFLLIKWVKHDIIVTLSTCNSRQSLLVLLRKSEWRALIILCISDMEGSRSCIAKDLSNPHKTLAFLKLFPQFLSLVLPHCFILVTLGGLKIMGLPCIDSSAVRTVGKVSGRQLWALPFIMCCCIHFSWCITAVGPFQWCDCTFMLTGKIHLLDVFIKPLKHVLCPQRLIHDKYKPRHLCAFCPLPCYDS